MAITSMLAPTETGRDLDVARMNEIEQIFLKQLSPLRLFPGAALAVYRGRQLIIDLTAGWADTQSGEGVTADTLFPLFSGTKPLVSVALLQQIERGRASLDDPVAAYWPEFGRNGKATITLRQILTHRGGFPTTPVDLPPASWSDLDAVLEAVSMMAPSIVPGAVSAYHFLTQQWVCAEIVYRLDGRLIQEYLREEITGPLGMMDTYLGLRPDQEGRLVKLHVTDGTDSWGVETLRSVRDSQFHRMVVPGGSAVSTARDICRFYAAIAAGGTLEGTRILRPETVDLMMNIEVDGETDPTFDVPVRRGLGFELGGLEDRRRHGPGATSTAHTFWHGGFGTSVCWGDRELGLSMAFMTNGIRRDEAVAIARRDLSDAVRALSH